MEKVFHNADGKRVLMRMVKAIQENKEYLLCGAGKNP